MRILPGHNGQSSRVTRALGEPEESGCLGRYGTRRLFAIAEGLTRDGISCSSSHDSARNPHRIGVCWSKSAVRVILTNPRNTGRQVWNEQRKNEVFLGTEDVSMGHVGVMRWNPADKWIYSDDIIHTLLAMRRWSGPDGGVRRCARARRPTGG
ncbi:recombinase family protein [Streptomyces sp. NPDC092296]|uniref:recombinase family protein n=1 Tax=Streptomyces sp. NPDC092296 TaxID=3366012 RepID=UPI003804012A